MHAKHRIEIDLCELHPAAGQHRRAGFLAREKLAADVVRQETNSRRRF